MRHFTLRLLLAVLLLAFSSLAMGQSAARLQAIDLVKEAATGFARGDLTLAIRICRQALAVDPTYPRAHTYLGAAFQKRGDKPSACTAFRRVIQLAPTGADSARARRGLQELGCGAATRAPLPPVFRPNLRLERRWKAPSGIAALSFSPDASQISGGSSDGAWLLWRARDGRLERLERGAGSAATATAIGPFNAVGYGDGKLRLFDARQDREVDFAPARAGAISALAYAPGGKFLAATGSDGALKIFDGRANTLLRQIAGEGLLVSGVAFSPNGRFLAVGMGSAVRIYQSDSGRLVRALRGDGLPVSALAWSRSGLLAGAIGYKIRVWNGATGRLERILTGHRLTVSALAFGKDNLLASGGYDAHLRLWNASTGASAVFALHGAQIRALSFDAGGKKLVSGDQKGLVGVWQLL